MDKSFRLEAVNALGETVRTVKQRSHFAGHANYFRVEQSEAAVKLVTPKGVYYLKWQAGEKAYVGFHKGNRIVVTLQKVVGTISYH